MSIGKDFRELDFDYQRMICEWIEKEANDGGIGEGQPRRFDQGMLVDDEIIGGLISKSFLDPEDDRVLDELLAREIGGGIKVADLMPRDELMTEPDAPGYRPHGHDVDDPKIRRP